MPILGHGDIASVLKDRHDLLFFASGVSNSKETREEEYNREVQLMMQQDKNKHIVYFSSLCVFTSNSRYAQHKKMMEGTARSYFDKSTIIRIGNISFGVNPHTIINFLKNKIRLGEEIEIQDTFRYIVDKEEFLYWIGLIPDWSCEMNITGERMKVEEIVRRIKNGEF
jgi:nucleoside-diphosphate-sugar epimerase